jgi:RimJ/RimL family protein N-acetyltransferase
MITFSPLRPADLPQLHRWLNQGEALRWYGRKISSAAEIREKYLQRLPVESTNHAFLIELDREPIGFLQCYRLADYPDYARLISAQPGDHGLDLFIGRDDLIGRGLGTEIVNTALAALIFSQPDARRCVLGPDPANRRAIRCYEKCGFRHERTVATSGGEDEYIMVCPRRRGQPSSASPSADRIRETNARNPANDAGRL